ncbi:MAG: hypothetical protein BME94_02170 [Methanobacteriales archaeon Met13]
MEMPITKPSMVSYADELEFSQLLEDFQKNKKNGFLRVTFVSEDGYLLFKNGKQVAASYDNLSKLDAIEKIKSVMEDDNTLVEIFDVRPSHVDYLMDLNKPYILEKGSAIEDVIGKLKKSNGKPEPEKVETTSVAEEKPEEENSLAVEEKPPVVEAQIEEPVVLKDPPVVEEKPPAESSELEKAPGQVKTDISSEAASVTSSTPETVDKTPINSATLEEKVTEAISPVEESHQDEIEASEEEEEAEPAPVDRLELLKKYGIRDIDESDVEKLLDSYKGGYMSDDDVEKIELTLMNRVKKSILGLPRVKGTEVMVFLDNAGGDLKGNINLIMEYQSQGLFSRIRGESKEIGNLKRQVVGITHIEIRKIFREYPEIVDKFDVNIEIS